MSYLSRIISSAKDTGSLNLNTVVAGTTTAGPTLLMEKVERFSLSAKVVVDAETDTIELNVVWQVSNNGTTWYSCRQSNGAADVTLATGTAGADAAVTVEVPASKAVYGWRYARCSVKNTVVNGTTNDTYRISYNYVRVGVAPPLVHPSRVDY